MTLDNADLDTVTLAVSTVIHLYTLEAARSDTPASSSAGSAHLELFDEAHTPLDKSGVWVSVPSVKVINAFLSDIQQNLQLDDTCIVSALVFVERAVFGSDLVVSARTWRVALLVALIVASKVVFDEEVFLGDFRERLPWLEACLSTQEAIFLEMIKYSTVIKSRQYAEYYYALLDVYKPSPTRRRLAVHTSGSDGERE